MNGQDDFAWVVFWLQVEAAVAVIVVSVSAYRSVFLADQSQYRESPRHRQTSRTKLWNRTKFSNYELPRIPSPTLTGMRTFFGNFPSREKEEISPHGIFVSLDDRAVPQAHRNPVSDEERTYQVLY